MATGEVRDLRLDEGAEDFALAPDGLSREVGVPAVAEKVGAPASVGKRVYLAVEMLVMFVVIPTLYWQKVVRLPLIAGILTFAALCLVLLLTDKTFDRRSLWRWEGMRREWKRIVVQWLVAGTFLALGTWLYAPERMFSFLRARPDVYIFVMLAYPVFSVYGQEMIYRVFFFHRYEQLLTRGWMRVALSALFFGYVHIMFSANPVISVVLSGLGGVLFAWTYERTRSCAAAGFEHALYGDTIWTVGLGTFFYAGPIR
jgi:membrane protease YdiL (CAAX protease family)